MRCLSLLSFVSSFLVTALPGEAQRVVLSGVALGEPFQTTINLATVDSLYLAAEWHQLVRHLESRLIAACDSAGPATCRHEFDFDKNVYFVVFRTETGILARIAMGADIEQPFSTILPGVSSSRPLYQVSLVASALDSIRSTYAIEAETSSTSDDLAKLLEKLIPAAAGALTPVSLEARNQAVISLVEIPMPFERATIAVKDQYYHGSNAPAQSSADSRWQNLPQSWWSVNLVGGVLVSETGGDTPAKLDGSTVVEDRIGRQMLMGAIHLHPWPRRTVHDLDPGQRVSLFAAGVINPKPGLAAGLGIQILARGILSVGHAWLRIDKASKPDDSGSVSLTRGWRTTVFVGLAYPIR